jgi:hypothetical protein
LIFSGWEMDECEGLGITGGLKHFSSDKDPYLTRPQHDRLVRCVHEIQRELFERLTSEHPADKYNPKLRARSKPIHWELYLASSIEYLWDCPHLLKQVPIEVVCLRAHSSGEWYYATSAAPTEYKTRNKSFPWSFGYEDSGVCYLDQFQIVLPTGGMACVASRNARNAIVQEGKRDYEVWQRSCVRDELLSNPYLSIEEARQVGGNHLEEVDTWERILHNPLDRVDPDQITAFRDMFTLVGVVTLPPLGDLIMKYAFETGPPLLEIKYGPQN